MNPLFVLLLLTKVGAEREEQKGIKAHDASTEPPVCKVHVVNTKESPGDEDLPKISKEWMDRRLSWMKTKNTKMKEKVTSWVGGMENVEIVPLAECIKKDGEKINSGRGSCEFFAHIYEQKKARAESRVGGNWDESLVTPFLYFDLAEFKANGFGYYETSHILGLKFKPEDVKAIVKDFCDSL